MQELEATDLERALGTVIATVVRSLRVQPGARGNEVRVDVDWLEARLRNVVILHQDQPGTDPLYLRHVLNLLAEVRKSDLLMDDPDSSQATYFHDPDDSR